LRRTADELGRASRQRFGTTVGVAPTSFTGSGDGVANSDVGGEREIGLNLFLNDFGGSIAQHK
jgi:nicotinamide mononucleotide (NMN) deamidase PncC